MLTFIRYIEVYFTFALVDCIRYNEDFVKSRFCSLRFTVILAGLKKIVPYTDDFVMKRLIKSRFPTAAGSFALTFEFLRTL